MGGWVFSKITHELVQFRLKCDLVDVGYSGDDIMDSSGSRNTCCVLFVGLMPYIARRTGIVCCLLVAVDAIAADWPRFRGPDNNGVATERDWNTRWSEKGPPVLWRIDVGVGYSSVAVDNGRLYTLGNEDNVDTVYCLAADSGEEIWSHAYKCATDPNEFEGGPTSTPTVFQDSVYTLSRSGDLFCFDAQTGAVEWRVNVPEVTSIRTPGWGFSGSPWVSDGLVVVNVGDAGVALSVKDGSVVWMSADKDSGYSSFVPIVQAGGNRLIFASARSYVCVDLRTGKECWRQRWLTTFGCNAADPIIANGNVFLSSGYNRGSALLEFVDGEPEVVWKTREFQNQLSTSVLLNGFLYGANGSVSNGASLACLRLKDGKVLWNEEGERVGGLMATGDYLIMMSDTGMLKIIKPNEVGPTIISEFRVFDEQCWTSPVLCNGRIFCRGAAGTLVCVDVQKTKQDSRRID